MQRMLCQLTALFTAVAAYRATAQDAVVVEDARLINRAYVILQGVEGLDSQLVSIVAQSLRPTLPEWPKDLSQGSASVAIEDQGVNLQGTRIAKLSVSVRQDKLQPTEAEMQELWDLARGQLAKELQRIAALAYEAQRVRAVRALDKHGAERETLEHQAAKLTEQVAMLEAETAGSDRDSLAKAIAEAVSNQRGLQLEAAGIQAQREAIENRIDELIAKHGPTEAAKTVISQLEKLVEIRQSQVTARTALGENGRKGGSALEIAEAQAELAGAVIELNRARQAAADQASGGALRELNNELSNLLVEAAKVEGQQKQLAQIIAELREQVLNTAQAAATLAPLRTQMQVILAQRQHVDSEIGNLRRSLDGLSESQITLQPLLDEQAAGEPEASAPGDPAAEDSPERE